MDETEVVPFAAHDDAVSASLRNAASMMDAMAYVEPGIQGREVNELIEAEMAAMAREKVAPPAVCADLRPPRFSGMVQAELDRLEHGDDLQPLSIERYNCEMPEAALQADAQAWRRALFNCWAQLEHQADRVVNLEVAESFAELAWARHVQDLEQLKHQIEMLADAKQREAEAINLKRRADQEKIAPTVDRLERERRALVEKHFQCVAIIRSICSARESCRLEQANAVLRASIAAREHSTQTDYDAPELTAHQDVRVAPTAT